MGYTLISGWELRRLREACGLTLAEVVAPQLLESRATAIVNFEPLVIPGLLQTVPYAEAIVRDVGMFSEQEEIDNRMVGRIHRQAVLRQHRASTLLAIVAESALRPLVGGREVMHDQLRYLAEAAERQHADQRRGLTKGWWWRWPRPRGEI